MEPKRLTSPDLLEIQRQLVDREPIFHRPEYGTTRAAFEAMMADEYWEVGASGRRYGREYILRVLVERHAQQIEDTHWRAEDFYCQRIADDNYLLTYTLHQSTLHHGGLDHTPDEHTRTTRRATLWRRTQRGWLIVFHQGTIVERAG